MVLRVGEEEQNQQNHLSIKMFNANASLNKHDEDPPYDIISPGMTASLPDLSHTYTGLESHVTVGVNAS